MRKYAVWILSALIAVGLAAVTAASDHFLQPPKGEGHNDKGACSTEHAAEQITPMTAFAPACTHGTTTTATTKKATTTTTQKTAAAKTTRQPPLPCPKANTSSKVCR